jgi:hypothetical protein
VQAQDLVRVCARAEHQSQDRQRKYSHQGMLLSCVQKSEFPLGETRMEASRASRRRAWDNLQEIRWVLKDAGSVELPPPARKTIDLEGRIVKDVAEPWLPLCQALFRKPLGSDESIITHRSPGPYGHGSGASGPISYWPAWPIFAFREFSSNYKRHKRQRVTCGANGFPD